MQAAKHIPAPQVAHPAHARVAVAGAPRGKHERQLRVLLHGVEGVGKSTFASLAPDPVFLCSEDGTAQLDVARFPAPRSWADVLEAVRVLTYEEHSYKTLVIDTLDWLEPVIFRHVCSMSGHAHIDEIPYGKGYQMAVEQWRLLVGRLEMMARSRKMNVILLAHSAIRRMDSEQGPIDRFQLKLNEKAAEVLREWCDVVLFARHEVVRIERRGGSRAVTTGARVAHPRWTKAYEAKNRFDLPETMPLAWDELEAAVDAYVPVDVDGFRRELLELIPRLSEAQKAAQVLRDWAGDDPVRLFQLLDRVRSKLALEGGGEGLVVPQPARSRVG